MKTVERGVWYPLGARSPRRRELRALLEARDRSLPAALRRAGRRADRRHPARTATSTSGTRLVKGLRAGQLYGYKVRGEYRPEHGACASTSQAPARSLREGGDRQVPQRRQPAARLRRPAGGARPSPRHARQRARSCRRPSSSTTPSTGRATPRPTSPLEQLVIYEVHVKGFTAHPSSGVRAPGHVPRLHREDPAPDAARRQCRRAPARARVLRRRLPGPAGPHELLGLQLDRLLRARVVVRAQAGRPAPGRRVQDARARAPRAGIKVILDVVYNHTGEGNELGPTMCFRGLDNPPTTSLTGPARRARPLLHELHGLRQQPQLRQPGRHPAGHGLAALLGEGDARRRLPVRPGLGAGPRRSRAARFRAVGARSSTRSRRTRC